MIKVIVATQILEYNSIKNSNIKPLQSPTTYLKSCVLCVPERLPFSGNLNLWAKIGFWFPINEMCKTALILRLKHITISSELPDDWKETKKSVPLQKQPNTKVLSRTGKAALCVHGGRTVLSDKWCNLDLSLSLCICSLILFVREWNDFNQMQRHVVKYYNSGLFQRKGIF